MDDPIDVPVRNELKKTIELTCFTRMDPEVLKSLQWDLAFELKKSLRPSVLRELTKKEPHRALYEETWPGIIAASLVKRIADMGWYVTRRPNHPSHSISLKTYTKPEDPTS